ncbi:MAG: hypothetical protein E7415_00860 [Ruminococcaceae bacterium]|nr:hypothetical protein [Oscillospiraceae bacterium]
MKACNINSYGTIVVDSNLAANNTEGVVHIAVHAEEHEEIIETLAGQGYAVGSVWSRGQAWAVYGFILSYIHTGEDKYLQTAKKLLIISWNLLKSQIIKLLLILQHQQSLYIMIIQQEFVQLVD